MFEHKMNWHFQCVAIFKRFLFYGAVFVVGSAILLAHSPRSARADGMSSSNIIERLFDAFPALKPSMTPEMKDFYSKTAWVAQTPDQKVWGYVDRHSLLPGESFKIMLSHAPNGRGIDGAVRISRITGNQNNLVEDTVFVSESLHTHYQGMGADASIIGVPWKPSLAVKTADDWKSGYYSVDFVDSTGHVDAHIASFVVRPLIKQGDVLVKLSTNTAQAYNAWGGASLYRSLTDRVGSSMVSG